MRTSTLVALAFLTLPAVTVAAPAPVPRSRISFQLEAVFRAAEDHVRSADRIWKRLCLELPPLTAEDKARAHDERRRALGSAAERFTRLIKLVDALEHPKPDVKELSARAGAGAVKALSDLGDHAEAIRLYGRLTHRPADPKARVSTMAIIVACRAQLGQRDEVRKQLLLIRKEVPKLDETDRVPWERWLADAENFVPR